MEKPVFHFGVDTCPEQWPESRWPEDACLFHQAGFNIVRLAEFARSRLEPVEGTFDFKWLDRALEVPQGKSMGSPTARLRSSTSVSSAKPDCTWPCSAGSYEVRFS